MPSNRRTWADYKWGIICPLPHERVAVEAMLDEVHTPIANRELDGNRYTFGRIGPHNVAVTSLRDDERGQAAAAAVASTFKWMRYCLVVGTASAIPCLTSQNDIRLGDIVVGAPESRRHPAVVEYVSGWFTEDGVEMLPSWSRPAPPLLQCIDGLECNYVHYGPTYLTHLSRMLYSSRTRQAVRRAYAYPADQDVLFDDATGSRQVVARRPRNGLRSMPGGLKAPFIRRHKEGNYDYPMVHYGTIACAEVDVQDARLRQDIYNGIRAQFRTKALCLGVEAAGILTVWQSAMVINGIRDYADSSKHDRWQNFAAASAAAYMKDLILAFAPSA